MCSAPSSGAAAPARLVAVSGLCRLLLALRLFVLAVTALVEARPARDYGPWLWVSLLAAGLCSALLLWRWRDGAALLSRPLYLGLDIAIAVVILVVTGPSGPFFFYTLGTATLAGALYRTGGVVYGSAALVAGYWVAAASHGHGMAFSFRDVAGLPALYVAFAAAGSALRGLLDREASAVAALHTSMAEERERARLARELHDLLGKSLHGIGLAAAGLEVMIGRDPPAAAGRAREIAAAAEVTAREARKLVTGLRVSPGQAPVGTAVRDTVVAWSAGAGVPAVVEVEDDVEADEAVRREMLGVLGEALTNVARHAGATRVRVQLRRTREGVELSVTDDGRGFEPTTDPGESLRREHFGLVGMTERAANAGGTLSIESSPGGGTTLLLRVAAAAETPGAAEVPAWRG